MAIEVAKVELKTVQDASGLEGLIAAGKFRTDEVIAVVGGAVYKALGAQDAGDIYPDGGATDYATPATALLGDNLNPLANDTAFKSTFPYLASPWAGNP